MGQIEVYEFLKQQRQSGNEQYFTVKDIKEALKNCPTHSKNIRGTWSAVCNLEASGHIETQDDFRRNVRLKKKYIK